MLDLQKENWVECVAKMFFSPGWEVLREGGLVALKSPARRPLANLVWGAPTLAGLDLCRRFYRARPFSWHLSPEQDPSPLLEAGFRKLDPTPEMVFDLAVARPWPPRPGVALTRPRSEEDLRGWAEVVGEGFGIPAEEVLEFHRPLLRQAGVIPFLAWHSGQPAASALLFPGSSCAGIYSVSTRGAFRRLGLGSAVIHACLQETERAGLSKAVLYASAMGRPFYEREGFTTVQVLDEYCTPNYPVSI